MDTPDSTRSTTPATPAHEKLSIERRFALWLAEGETGMSSEAIAVVMLAGEPLPATWRTMYYPRDIADFRRCLLLLARIPEWRARLGEMAGVSPQWARLAEHWGELEKLYFAVVAQGVEHVWYAPEQAAFRSRLLQLTKEEPA